MTSLYALIYHSIQAYFRAILSVSGHGMSAFLARESYKELHYDLKYYTIACMMMRFIILADTNVAKKGINIYID